MKIEQAPSLLPTILSRLDRDAPKVSFFEAIVALYACGKTETVSSLLTTEDVGEINHDMAFFVVEAFWATGDDFWLEMAHKCHLEQVILSLGEGFMDDQLFDQLYSTEAFHHLVEKMIEGEWWNGDTMVTTSYGQASLRALLVMDNLTMATSILKHDLKHGISTEEKKEEFATALALRYFNYANGNKEVDKLWGDVLKSSPPQTNQPLTDFSFYQLQRTGLRSDAPLHVLIGHPLYKRDESPIGQVLRDYYEDWAARDWVSTMKHTIHVHISMDDKNDYLHSTIDQGLNHVDDGFRRKVIFASVNNSEHFWKQLTFHPSFERLLSTDEVVEILSTWQQKHPLSTKTTKGSGFWGCEAETMLAFYRFLKWGPEELEQRLRPNFDNLFEGIKSNPQSYLPFFARGKEKENEVTKSDLKLALIDLSKGWDGEVVAERPKLARKM